uniref:Reverse transcriptase domain-containing protein n=1 Tax=Xenopus tropicalis TaxID=8364 RepID=A0A803K7B8_XENTR
MGQFLHNFLEQCGLTTLTKEKLKSQNRDTVDEGEIMEAIASLPLNKSPGPDGLTSEFYKAFSKELSPILQKVFTQFLQAGQLPRSLRESALILLSKGKDRRQITNWRPIALLNTDRKILAKVLFNRLYAVSEPLLSEDQYCAVKGRGVLQAVAVIRETIEYAKVTNCEKYLLGLDQAKAGCNTGTCGLLYLSMASWFHLSIG